MLTFDDARPTTTITFSKRKRQLAHLPASPSARSCLDVFAILEHQDRSGAILLSSSHRSKSAVLNALVALLVLEPDARHPLPKTA